MAVAWFCLCVPTFMFAYGSRISVRSQLDASSASRARVGPEGEPWERNVKYVCMRKWQVGVMSSAFADSFCLANYAKAQSSAHFETAKELTACESTKHAHMMKTCALKGEPADMRLSYSTKTHVAKSCFRFSSADVNVLLIEAALDESECIAEMRKSSGEQGVIKAKLTTTTTTTITSTTTGSDVHIGEPEAIDSDVLAGDDGMMIIEAKALFTSGEKKLWEYNGKAIKCCVSSAGKPTQLQDINMEELPAARRFGRRTGCGYMFGDTYHNGPERYDKCPVRASVLRKYRGGFRVNIDSLLEAGSSFETTQP
mmetsp:Transcript_49640/g.77490  ORF Transcript_49640/g.77490 Transcript_49640/m.77490 type:complete len:312 (-) Transcript_49640:70-1005(-)